VISYLYSSSYFEYSQIISLLSISQQLLPFTAVSIILRVMEVKQISKTISSPAPTDWSGSKY